MTNSDELLEKKLAFSRYRERLRSILSACGGLGFAMLASLAATVAILGAQSIGWLERSELAAYDWMVRWQDTVGADPRLLVVGITEGDIRRFKQLPLSDRILAKTLAELQKHEPAAIGIDIYRDFPIPPGHDELVEQFSKENVFVIRSIDVKEGVGNPPSVEDSDRIGFNDVPVDRDGVVRRNLMFASIGDDVLYSLSLRLALKYVDEYLGAKPTNDERDPGKIIWGEATFERLQPNAGAYQQIDNAGYQILLQYRTSNGIAPRVSFGEVFDGRVDPDLVRDKIVLIGTVAKSQRDVFLTPYSPSQEREFKMPGVELHAHMVSQFISAVEGSELLFRFWADWQEVLWILLWALVGGSLAWRVTHPISVLLAGAISTAVLWASVWVLFARQIWIPAIAPTLAGPIASSLVVAYRAYQSGQQQKTVMKLLGQNVSPEVADALWQNRDRLLKSGQLPGQRAIATTLFTDIRNFSTISEQMPSDKLFDWLNEYLAGMAEAVRNHQGIINKFTGDGMMAVFGVPVARASDAEISLDAQQAVACGLEMSDRLAELNREWKKRGLPVIQMRVGIYTGPVMVGSIGSRHRMEYGVIGDSVNIASRLESCQKDRQTTLCRVLIAAETLKHLDDRYWVEHWGPLTLKGKHQMVEVYHVLRSRANDEGKSMPGVGF